MPLQQVYSAQDIAKYFIWKSHKDGRPITNKKLQKLLYYAQAWSLTLEGKPIFGEKIEAWIHGPVVNIVYQQYKQFGYKDIDVAVSEKDTEAINEATISLLEEVWRTYGKYDAPYLESLTHSESPWQDARSGLELNMSSDIEITHSSMKEYYSRLLKESSDDHRS